MPNPFEIKSAELMAPEQVAGEFVKEHTEYAKLAAHSHTIMWGSRGSGKSMHLRYLEPLAQNHARRMVNESASTVIADANGFIGVYVNCRDSVLNRYELRHVSATGANNDLVVSLLDRYLACAIARATVITFLSQLPEVCSRPANQVPLPLALRAVLPDDATSVGQVIEALHEKCEEWLYGLGKIAGDLFRGVDGAAVLDEFPREALRATVDIPDLFRWFQQAIGVQVPFFLLLDEANELCNIHQKCINSLIALRSQAFLCVKVASQRNGFAAGRTLDGAVDETHDFTTIDLDGLYTNNREAYYKRIERIANDRIGRAGLCTSIQQYLPDNPSELADLQKAREMAGERYDKMDSDHRPKDRDNYIKKYAPAIVFQALSAKSSKTYAGFDNVVHLSSGIVRSFLDCCSKMYSRYGEKYPDRDEPSYIPVEIQGEVIRDYSDQFIRAQILDKIRAIDPDSPERETRRKLYNLLKGLGALFRGRLMDADSREPRIISISLKDDPDQELEEVLDLAIREAFLHEKWYRSKRGNRNLRCYVLNRRLCPHFNLDVTGFQGRMEISSSDMAIALRDADAFAKKALRQREDESTNDPTQLMLFDM